MPICFTSSLLLAALSWVPVEGLAQNLKPVCSAWKVSLAVVTNWLILLAGFVFLWRKEFWQPLSWVKPRLLFGDVEAGRALMSFVKGGAILYPPPHAGLFLVLQRILNVLVLKYSQVSVAF